MDIRHRGLLEGLAETAAGHPSKALLGDERGWMDAGSVHTAVLRTGSALRAMGLGRGKMVALRAHRTAQTSVMLLGLRASGATAVLTDPRLEVPAALAEADVPGDIFAGIEQTGEDTFRISLAGAEHELDLKALPAETDTPIFTDPMDPAFVIFTSGSTGKSKAVVLSEWNLVANLVDSFPLGDYREDDLALGALPLHHVFGLVLLCGMAVLGYGVYFPEKTDVESLLHAIESRRLTRMNGVPALYLKMAEKMGRYDLSSLRTGFIGGGPVTEEQFFYLEKTLQMTLIPVYGMSECIGISCASYRDPGKVRATSVGRFYSMNRGVILREDGTEAERGESGEICVDGPSRSPGYLGQDTISGGLLHTGDLGYVDEKGYLHLSGRKKDVIIRNGNNLSPLKIQRAILALPGVKDAVVVGIGDAREGEVPAAMVVAEDGVREIHPALPKNELPAVCMFVSALPMTSSGKPDTLRIREVLKTCRSL